MKKEKWIPSFSIKSSLAAQRDAAQRLTHLMRRTAVEEDEERVAAAAESAATSGGNWESRQGTLPDVWRSSTWKIDLDRAGDPAKQASKGVPRVVRGNFPRGLPPWGKGREPGGETSFQTSPESDLGIQLSSHTFTDDPGPIRLIIPLYRTSLPYKIALQVSELLLLFFAPRKSEFGKYFPFKTLEHSASRRVNSLHTYFPNIALLKSDMSLNPIPPSSLESVSLFHLSQCTL
jgi:hypothetical protein